LKSSNWRLRDWLNLKRKKMTSARRNKLLKMPLSNAVRKPKIVLRKLPAKPKSSTMQPRKKLRENARRGKRTGVEEATT